MRVIHDSDGRQWTVSEHRCTDVAGASRHSSEHHAPTQPAAASDKAMLVFEASDAGEVRILGGVAPTNWRDSDPAQLVAWLEMARPLSRQS